MIKFEDDPKLYDDSSLQNLLNYCDDQEIWDEYQLFFKQMGQLLRGVKTLRDRSHLISNLFNSPVLLRRNYIGMNNIWVANVDGRQYCIFDCLDKGVSIDMAKKYLKSDIKSDLVILNDYLFGK